MTTLETRTHEQAARAAIAKWSYRWGLGESGPGAELAALEFNPAFVKFVVALESERTGEVAINALDDAMTEAVDSAYHALKALGRLHGADFRSLLKQI